MWHTLTIQLRHETADDIAAIEAVTTAAFALKAKPAVAVAWPPSQVTIAVFSPAVLADAFWGNRHS